MTAIAADMDAERQIEFLGAREDRPVAPPPQRLVRAWRYVDLNIFSNFGAALDLGDRRFGVVLSDQDRGFQARIAIAPVRELPFIDGALDRSTKFQVLLREDEE